MSVLVYSEEMFAFVGMLGLGTVHQHPVPACLFALDGPFRIRYGAEGWVTTHGALIPANVAHEIDGAAQQVAVCYLDPLRARYHLSGKHIRLADHQSRWCRLGRQLAVDVAEAADPSAASAALSRALQETIVSQAGWTATKRPIDLRLTALAKEFATLNASLDLAQAAKRAHLSPSRFSHRFTALTGLRWTRYNNWQRLLQSSSRMLDSTQPLTLIAMDQGYSSPSHLSAAFRQSFGVAPSHIRPRPATRPEPAT